MLINNKQNGSSTSGFLTASAIYVGLLVYANFYAFEQVPHSGSSAAEPSTENLVSKVAPASPQTTDDSGSFIEKPAIVAPQAGGMFTSEPISSEQSDFDKGSSATRVTSIEQNAVVQHEAPSGSSSKRLAAGPAVYYPGRYTSPYYYPRVPYNDADRMAGYHRYQSDGRFDYGNNYQAMNQGRGYGRGEGDMNGDGELDFSMRMQSRARMDADSDWDANGYTDANGYHGSYYGNNWTQHPAYNGYYRQY